MPETSSENAEPPAVAPFGEMPVPSVLMVGAGPTVKIRPLEMAPVDPLPGFWTVIRAVPGVASRDAGTIAVSDCAFTKVVGSGVAWPSPLFHNTVDPLRKFRPVIWIAKEGTFTPDVAGLSVVKLGPLIETENGADVTFEVVFSAEMTAVPDCTSRFAGTTAVISVELTNCEVSVVDVPAFHCICVLESKNCPVRVNVTPEDPATRGNGAAPVTASCPTVKFTGGDTEPLGFKTATATCPDVATWSAGTGTVMVLGLKEVKLEGGRGAWLPQSTDAPLAKFWPLIVSVNFGLPASANDGLRADTVRDEIGKVMALEVVAGLVGFAGSLATVICAVPTELI